MIKKRTEKDGIVKGIYESSNILASKYDQKTKELTITFNYGGQYTYNNVKATDYARLETAESQGKVFNSHIKNVYEFDNLGKIDTKLIKESLKEAVKNEILEYLQGIANDMINITTDIKHHDTIDIFRLDDLVGKFEIYKKML